jgi:DNA segregation ATPase FtsK/SpoIIIE, S-DNA-T family
MARLGTRPRRGRALTRSTSRTHSRGLRRHSALDQFMRGLGHWLGPVLTLGSLLAVAFVAYVVATGDVVTLTEVTEAGSALGQDLADVAKSTRDWIVETFGFGFLPLALFAAASLLLIAVLPERGTGFWRRWLAWLCFAAFICGGLGLYHPQTFIGNVSLAEVSAGGELGELLTGGMWGVVAWLLLLLMGLTLMWPSSMGRIAGDIPVIVDAMDVPGKAWWLLGAMLAALAAAFRWATKERETPAAPEILTYDEPLAVAPQESPVFPAEDTRDAVDVAFAEHQPSLAELAEALEQKNGAALDPVLRISLEAEEDQPSQKAIAWQPPPIGVLVESTSEKSARIDNSQRAQLIEKTLASFGVDGRVVQINQGPTVTQFGIEPGWEVKTRAVPEKDGTGKPILDREGKPRQRTEEVSRTRVRVNQITALANDLALALAAPTIRIEAPVPGKPVVGVEVPNHVATTVTLRSVIESAPFQKSIGRSRLTLALGQSVSGEAIVADLTRMPHLLIAGSTGSGKSVCINSIICCVLMHCSPADVRFVMVDPKRVELAPFALIPHLAFSKIVTEMDKVVGTLQAVIHEMEMRYKAFARVAVRNIESYNRSPQAKAPLPYWVVIIDELADLMMAAPYEVERQICRLAQLARATGIHLVVATQRPSVDVVTGLIKANFPTRIAFAMSSQVDSRTILDMGGAERLLGKGDMLFMPTDAAKPKRIQGVFVSDQEIERLVAFWAAQKLKNPALDTFDDLLTEAKEAMEAEATADPVMVQARDLAGEHKRISTSLLQRRLRIGYPRAARIMDQLEQEGVVGPAEGGGSREVLAVEMEEEPSFY